MTRRPLCLVCLFLMLFLAAGDWLGFPFIRGNPLPDYLKEWIKEHPESVVCGEVESFRDTEFSQTVSLNESYLIYRSKKFPIKNITVYLKKREELKPGMYLCVRGILEELSLPRNPGEFNARQYYACDHMYYSVKKGEVLKKGKEGNAYQTLLLRIREHLNGVLEGTAGEAAPVFAAMVLGEKGELPKETKMLYQMAGIIHILAISGVKTLKLDIPLVPETRINWAFVPLHIAIIYILKLCLDEEIIPRCRFPCSRGYFTKCINWQKKQ